MYQLFGQKQNERSNTSTPPKRLTHEEDVMSPTNFELEEFIEQTSQEIRAEAEATRAEAMKMAPSIPDIFTMIEPPRDASEAVQRAAAPPPPPPVLPARNKAQEPRVWTLPDSMPAAPKAEAVPPELPPRERTPQPVITPIPNPAPVKPLPPPPQQPKPRPAPPQPRRADPEPEVPSKGGGSSSLEELSQLIMDMNAGVMKRVNELEDLVVKRSAEIRSEAKTSFEEALEKAKRIKEVMHDSELKNLELQMKHMEILDAAEEKALQRAERMKGL